MVTTFKFICPLLLLFVSAGLCDVSQEDIQNYLLSAVAKYPAWLKRNNLDPYRDPQWKYSVKDSWFGVNYNLDLKNMEVINHSILEPTRTKVTVHLATRDIDIVYKVTDRDVFFSGEYNVTGDVDGGTPFQGQGEWNTVANYSRVNNASILFQYTMEGFEITPDCRFDFSSTKNWSFVYFRPTTTFLNLDAGSEENNQRVEKELSLVMLEYLNRGEGNPLWKMMTAYLTEVFEAQPVCKPEKNENKIRNSSP